MTSVGLVAEMGRSMLRPYKGWSGGEAGFGEGDGEAAVGNVVGGLDSALGGESDETINEAFFASEVDGGRFAGDNASGCLCIFGGGEFAGQFRSGEWRVTSGE